MVTQERRSAPRAHEEEAAEVASAVQGPGNRELLDALRLSLPPARDPEEERPWIEAPEYGVASMLVGLRAPAATACDPR